MKSLIFIEIDLPSCTRTYGVAPCTAAIGVTGAIKCFNTRKTCQDIANYAETAVTLRFAMDAAYLPEAIEAIPSIEEVEITPGIVSLGGDLGQRGTLKVTFTDHRHSDTGPGFDKYLADRTYDPYAQGTFFGKLRARQPFLRGRAIRLITGLVPDSFPSATLQGTALSAGVLQNQDVRHYLIESVDGPKRDGSFEIVAKDPLKFADGDRAQAPALSNGFLVADITAADVSATLSPAGIGNAEYPAAGHVNIGGNEICAFTRAGDVLTLTRGQLGSVASAHKAQDRVQLVLRFVAQDPANIIKDLLTLYADVPSAYIPIAAWLNETAAFLNRVYTATIAEPTPVAKLVSEVIEQAALAIGWDDSAQLIRLQVLRAIPTDVDRFSADNIIEGTLEPKEQAEKRLSRVWTYFGQRDPTKRVDDADNYVSSVETIDTAAETEYGQPAIKKIFARWIPALGRATAQRLNDIQLGRFRDPPRRLAFHVMRHAGQNPVLLGGYQLAGWLFQDATGAAIDVPIQVTRLNPRVERFQCEAEEVLFKGTVDTGRTIIIDVNTNNINFRTVHDALYPTPQAGDTVTCIIQAGVIVGSTSISAPAFDVGPWPAGVTLTLRIEGRIQGRGGAGASAASVPQVGGAGGPALYSRRAFNLDVDLGQIWGGGGGGASPERGGGGGGGAGQIPGAGGDGWSTIATDGASGTTEAGGAGGSPGGGNGGGPGLPGQPATQASGGAAGAAIDGVSFVTVTQGPGDIRGAQIN